MKITMTRADLVDALTMASFAYRLSAEDYDEHGKVMALEDSKRTNQLAQWLDDGASFEMED